jgi:NAD(P)-dependent dehydrogenase (short-subunit alcohol dehydrogenase family)
MVNAGISYAPGSTREHYQKVFDTNVFAVAVTIDTFLPLLRKSKAEGGKRIAFTSSSMASLKYAAEETDTNNGHFAVHYPIYRSSKAAMTVLMLHYTRLLEGEGFVVTASNPGYCATNLNAYNGLKDPREGAKAVVRGAIGDKKDVHGKHIDEDEGNFVPW